MKITRILYEGEWIPFGWGIVRYDYMRDGIEYAPIPINFVRRFIWWAMCWSHKQRPLTDEELWNHARVQAEIERRIFSHGIERYNAGYEKGFEAGWTGFAKQALERLDEEREPG